MPPPQKRPKIDAVRLMGNRRLTANHIRAVLDALPTDTGVNFEAINIHEDFHTATEKLYDDDIAASIPLQLKQGTVFPWPVARPQALIRSLVKISPSLRCMIAATPSTHDKPWKIVIYIDEVTPGNISAPMNSRKFVAVYYTFKELASLVRSQDFWFHFGVLRTNVLKFVEGGYGAMTKAIVHTFISDVESFCHVGIAIDVGFGPCLWPQSS